MQQYQGKMVDPKKNITYGSCRKEHFEMFSSNPTKAYPLRVEMIGITYPDRDYFIERKHADYFVFEYVVSGKGYIEQGDNRWTVGEDCVYILQPGASHRYGADARHPYQKLWINFFSDIMTDVLAAYGLSSQTVFPDSGCRKYFDELLELAQQYTVNDEVYLKVSDILFRMVMKLARRANGGNKASTLANSVKNALDASVYRKVTVEMIADQLSISKSQMTREFKRYYGVTPYRYILDRKIAVARRLLLVTDMKVFEISAQLGFADEYYFSDLFKAKTGVSPLKFRYGK